MLEYLPVTRPVNHGRGDQGDGEHGKEHAGERSLDATFVAGDVSRGPGDEVAWRSANGMGYHGAGHLAVLQRERIEVGRRLFARRAHAALLGFPLSFVIHARIPMRDSSISRSIRRLRKRWLLMVPSAMPVTRAISPIGISSRW